MSSDTASHPANRPGPPGRGPVLLLAVTVGTVVANLYYVQPLLGSIARGFGVPPTAAGILVTAGQAGYVAGLVLLVPLGDLLERRRLVVVLLLGTALAAVGCALAPGLPVLAVALAGLGALSVVGSVLVALAATLAAPGRAGQVVGTVMSGLLLGILLARTVSGLLAGLGGFRVVFAVAAAATAVLAALLARWLPRVPAADPVRYRDGLRSVVTLVRAEPVLRQRMALGFCQMASFTVVWTTLAFLLGGHYHYGDTVIGLFGLAGVAGALVTPLAGRLADRGGLGAASTAFLAVLLTSWAALAAGGRSPVLLVVGLVLLDLGVNGAQVANQTAIYALRPEARSRMTTASSVAFFTGGAVGSLLAAPLYAAGGWPASCALGAGFAAVALLLRLVVVRHGAPRTPAHPSKTGERP